MIERLVARTAPAVVVVGLAAAGCGVVPESGADRGPTSASPSASADSSVAAPTPSRRPVAAAGGLCKLLSYELVAQTTRVEFDAAAGGRTGCALQVYGHPYPSLTLGLSATKAGPKTFLKAVPPPGATVVDGLGKAAYRGFQRPSTARTGPSAEVGWLVDGKIYILRYTFERGTSFGQAAQMSRSLLVLAKRINPPN